MSRVKTSSKWGGCACRVDRLPIQMENKNPWTAEEEETGDFGEQRAGWAKPSVRPSLASRYAQVLTEDCGEQVPRLLPE